MALNIVAYHQTTNRQPAGAPSIGPLSLLAKPRGYRPRGDSLQAAHDLGSVTKLS